MSGCEGAEDEYDTYALQLAKMLGEGADADAIAKYLDWVITDRMSGPNNAEHNRAIAVKAVAIRKSKSPD